MAISKIQYDDKVAINIDSTIPDINKCNASDLNEIKSVVNNNADEIPSNDNLVNVGTSVDTDYRTNILTTKNLFDKNTALLNTGINNSTGIPTTQNNVFLSDFIKVEPNTDYYISGGITSVFGYSISKTYIGEIIDTSGNKTFNSGNAEYVRVKSWYASSSDAMQTQLNNSLMNIGTSAIPYEPFIQNTINVNNEKYTDTINVGNEINNKNRINVLYSHNLLNYTISSSETLGITRQMQGSKLILNGTTTGSGDIYLYSLNTFTLKAGTYTISSNVLSGTFNKYGKDVAIYLRNASSNSVLFEITANEYNYIRTTTITLSEDTNIKIQIYTNGAGFVFNNFELGIMINKGSTALSYEPYLIPSINIDSEEIYKQVNIGASKETSPVGYQFNINEFYIYTWTLVRSFSNGLCNVDISNLNFVEIPSVQVIVSSENYPIKYDRDNSTKDSIRLYLINNGSVYNKTGNVRFEITLFGKKSS